MVNRSGRIGLLLLIPAALILYGFTNPHAGPDTCGSCHSAVPTADDAAARDYKLLGGTIDGTCRACHREKYCTLGSYQAFHPSGIDEWEDWIARPPRTVPLFGGFITCATCHLHRRPGEPDYKMLRLTRVEGDKVDTTELCRDCHPTFY